jgi:hypothetical protein
MENKSSLDTEYSKIVADNPDKKFILYLRRHPGNEKEEKLKADLVTLYGECKDVPDERLTIFIVSGNKVREFIDILNNTESSMYLSFIQCDDELKGESK